MKFRNPKQTICSDKKSSIDNYMQYTLKKKVLHFVIQFNDISTVRTVKKQSNNVYT